MLLIGHDFIVVLDHTLTLTLTLTLKIAKHTDLIQSELRNVIGVST